MMSLGKKVHSDEINKQLLTGPMDSDNRTSLTSMAMEDADSSRKRKQVDDDFSFYGKALKEPMLETVPEDMSNQLGCTLKIKNKRFSSLMSSGTEKSEGTPMDVRAKKTYSGVLMSKGKAASTSEKGKQMECKNNSSVNTRKQKKVMPMEEAETLPYYIGFFSGKKEAFPADFKRYKVDKEKKPKTKCLSGLHENEALPAMGNNQTQPAGRNMYQGLNSSTYQTCSDEGTNGLSTNQIDLYHLKVSLKARKEGNGSEFDRNLTNDIDTSNTYTYPVLFNESLNQTSDNEGFGYGLPSQAQQDHTVRMEQNVSSSEQNGLEKTDFVNSQVSSIDAPSMPLDGAEIEDRPLNKIVGEANITMSGKQQIYNALQATGDMTNEAEALLLQTSLYLANNPALAEEVISSGHFQNAQMPQTPTATHLQKSQLPLPVANVSSRIVSLPQQELWNNVADTWTVQLPQQASKKQANYMATGKIESNGVASLQILPATKVNNISNTPAITGQSSSQTIPATSLQKKSCQSLNPDPNKSSGSEMQTEVNSYTDDGFQSFDDDTDFLLQY